MTLLCKYSRPEWNRLPASHVAFGHRHGLRYEGLVYRHVLEPLKTTAPRLYGIVDGRPARTWIAIEYLDGCERISRAPAGPLAAASWIGRFHAANEARLSDPSLRFLHTYAAAYYRGWAERTLRGARRGRHDRGQFDRIGPAFEHAIDILLQAPPTIIHGEYYPANVLWHRNRIRPVDWESTAIAAGEIDLASLTDHWEPHVAERCEAAYFGARWPGTVDRSAFARRLLAARLYLALRWAGVPGAWRAPADRAHYAKRVGRELGRFLEAVGVPRHAAVG